MNPLLVTLIIYILIIFGIGYCAVHRNKTLSDYVLGGRSLSGTIAALGAGASDMSSWLLLALPGAVLLHGVSEIWLPIGLAIGAYLNWQFVAKRLRVYTEIAGDALTVPSYFHNRFKDRSCVLKTLTAVVVLVFFTFYASASFVSIGLLFHTMFGISYTHAIFVGAAIILVYTIVGGFLAISWIDFFQGNLMFLALICVPAVTLYSLHGLHPTLDLIHAQGSYFLDAYHGVTIVGVISLLTWGLGYFGQPHILVRFMAAKSHHEIPKAQFICMTWMVFSLYGAVCTGLFGIAYFAHQPLANPETAFIYLAHNLFNPWVTGFLLAAVLSANMSTSSAQLLASSSAITEDLYHTFFRRRASQRELILVGRFGVLVIAMIALFLAINPQNSILNLVAHAWAGLGASFGPVILISLFWPRMTRNGAFAGMLVGALTVLIWPKIALVKALYELFPGFMLASLTIVVVSLLDKRPSSAIQEEFKKVREILRQ
ncbi:MAG: sodium/proline symporter PutP [Gammaproteobacteria bacterium]|nr:sodium/proline symporter PutP [Gammaproteobacteria bacterium]